MTEDLQEFLNRASDGSQVDWSTTAWRAAQPIFEWLGYAEVRDGGSTEPPPLDPKDLDILCRQMFLRFHTSAGELAWSSRMIGEAVEAVARVVDGPPEIFVRAVWSCFNDVPATPLVFEFCRALGTTLLSRYRGSDFGWDLGWMTGPATPSQLCLRYWVLGLRPDLFDDSLFSKTQSVLEAHGIDA